MKLLKSERMNLPDIYFVSTKEEMAEIPLGIPFIRGKTEDYDFYVSIMEYQIIMRSIEDTGLPFNKDALLKGSRLFDKDYKRIAESSFTTEHMGFYNEVHEILKIDTSYLVDLNKLKELHVIPEWFIKMEDAIKINILNTISYNPNLYNKKLDLVSGNMEYASPDKSLIIIDISGSIPKSISTAVLMISKTMAENFYADILITGSKSTLYLYEELSDLTVKSIYQENGTDNDQTYFKELVSTYRKYGNVFCFGDNHSPSMSWRNDYNKGTKGIEISVGQEICKWEINHLYSFHTTSNTTIAGYADWFVPREITNITDWVKHLD